MKYRKKPVEIEAFRFGIDESPKWFTALVKKREINVYNQLCGESIWCEIKMKAGVRLADYGDYIIKTDKDDIYPVKPNDFYATYEKVN